VAAAAAGAPAAVSDRRTAAVVVMRRVLVMSTCLCWFVDRRVQSIRPGPCPRLVEKRSMPV